MNLNTNTIKTPSYTAIVGNEWARQFPTQEQADAWAADIRGRLLWAEEIGLLALVNGREKRWGKNGYEYPGFYRDQGSGLLRLSYQRIAYYVGEWICARHWPSMKDYVWQIDLTDLVVDNRVWKRAQVVGKAEDIPENIGIPSDWIVREDGYYYERVPYYECPLERVHWELVITVQEQLL